MKKVCISTYCEWDSYGSVLQAIGLKRALNANGFSSFIIRDNPAPVIQPKFRFEFSKDLRKLLINLNSIKTRKKKESRYRRSVEFIRKNVDIQYYNDYETLRKNYPVADYYITGSDQVWHPQCCNPAFFLDFLPTDVKRLSYAASMGVSNIPSEKKELFVNLLSGIDELSVREEDAADIVNKCLGRRAQVHIDPTFFVDADEWRTFESKYPLDRPYILVYVIYWDRQLNAQLKELHRKTGCDIVLCHSGVSGVWATRTVYDADPGQFLYLIDHAQAVISSSFHGVALAFNFNKKIAPVINPNAPARIQSLIDMFGIKRVEIADVMDFDIGQYADINACIRKEKEKGMDYLKEILCLRE